MQKQAIISGSSRIDENISAIENYIALNNSTKSFNKTFPLTGIEQPFVTFSELELAALLWQNEAIKTKLQTLALGDFEDKTIRLSQVDILQWLQDKPPGFLLSAMLSNIGQKAPRKGRRNYKDRTILMSLDEMQSHLQRIREPGFDSQTYRTKGYALRGSIKTDGFHLQVLAFKLSELSAVKYKRLPQDLMPRRITSALGGLDDYLTEIRNVIKTPQDVADIFDCPPEQIKILGIDMGQACVIGASAILPSKKPTKTARKPVFFNLAVKQKAVSQPSFKHRAWTEKQKASAQQEGLDSIQDIESKLPPLRGVGASASAHLEKLEQAQEQLEAFYNGSNHKYKKHAWDARRARESEYDRMTDSLLRVVGGSIGQKRHDNNKVIIGIGLSKFSSRIRLSSLDGTFLSYFVRKVSK